MLKIGADAMDEPVTGLPEGTPATSWLRYQIERVYAQIRESMLADTSKPFTNDEFENADRADAGVREGTARRT